MNFQLTGHAEMSLNVFLHMLPFDKHSDEETMTHSFDSS